MFDMLARPVVAMIGWQEGLVIVAIIALLFGAKKIPELFKGLGTGVREFKKGINEPIEEVKSTVTEAATPALKEDSSTE